MRFITALIAVAYASDPCSDLCQLDGPTVCTGGSWTKGNSICHGYMYRGNPEDGDYCYHTVFTAVSCPESGVPVKASEARDLIERRRETVNNNAEESEERSDTRLENLDDLGELASILGLNPYIFDGNTILLSAERLAALLDLNLDRLDEQLMASSQSGEE